MIVSCRQTALVLVCLSTIFAASDFARAEPEISTTPKVDFRRDIRPLLSKACFHCHGPDEETREADLRLDTLDGATADLGGYAAVMAGDAEASELMQRIASDDLDLRMPPAEMGDALSDDEVSLFRRWIEQGAPWAKHWAYVAPRQSKIPDVAGKPWTGNPIDAFVRARLVAENLPPAPAADQTTALRRLSLDLVGLPPTPEEVDRFLADDSPDAYERQVDRLMSSPHFGERWGRLWLDAARYADSNGFEQDKPRNVWFYRDWVIQALNQDMPYDQFVIEQIAGDLLPNATQSQHVATGFLRNSMTNEEGGIDPEQFRMEAMYDRMDAIGSGILGLTVRCAQCHSHKYDPLSHDEYYQMFAFLNNFHEAEIAVYSPGDQRIRQKVLDGIQEIEQQLRQQTPDWVKQMADWEAATRLQEQPEWTVVKLEFDDSAAGGTKFQTHADGSYLAHGFVSYSSHPLMWAITDLPKVTAIRLELLTDPNLPFNGPGRSSVGSCALTEFSVSSSPLAGSEAAEEQPEKIARATADISLSKRPISHLFPRKPEALIPEAERKEAKEKNVPRFVGPIQFAIDGKDETAWTIDAGPGLRNQPRKAVFVFADPIANPGGTKLSIRLKQQHGGWNNGDRHENNLGRFRISVTNSPDLVADPLPTEVRQILSIDAQQRTEKQRLQLFSYWRTTVPKWRDANERIDALWEQYPAGTSQLTVIERKKPRTTYRLERGDFLSPAEEVESDVPSFLHPFPADAPRNRLGFARWLVDRRSPTAARAIVNRLWQAYFGIGLVRTPYDLGSQGEIPSHSELLDWLATELVDHNWKLKHLHQLIVTSGTYRQSSTVSKSLVSLDPANRLLARGPRHRVDAEIVRDISLFASGLLNLEVGGPSVYPEAPAFLFLKPASYLEKTWDVSTGPARYRRAMYTFAFRTVPFPALQSFDAPNGEASCVRRSMSNTPLQALTTLNEPSFVECAQALALRTVTETKATDDRLTLAFRRCVSRPPTEEERTVLLDLLQTQTARFEKGELQPETLLGSEKPGADISPAELAGWTVVARVLLNLDETISKE